MLCVDLFSGLGGFSEAFLKRGHDVIRIDNDERFKDVPCTIIADVRELPLKRGLKPDILLMSPPCNCFSVQVINKYWDDHIPRTERTVQALRVVGWALDAVDFLEPSYWLLENPRAMLRTILGKPKVTTYFASWGELHFKPTDVWGRIPPGMVWPRPKDWLKVPRSANSGTRSLSAEEAAKIPYPLSEALCKAMEEDGHANL